ncbi:MAG: hypothetical protein WBX25_14345 [Rhodomicrobium sp.]
MAVRCSGCGVILEPWEVRCTRCAVLTDTLDCLNILASGHSLAYRVARSLTTAAGGALAGAFGFFVALAVFRFLPSLFGGVVLSIAQAVVTLGGVLAAVIGFSAIAVSFGELQRNASFEVSKEVLRFNDLHDPSGAEAKFIEREIALAAVSRVRADQSWLGRLFDYGTIEIFTNCSLNPSAVIPGLSRPHAFKEKLELILKNREGVRG